MFSVSQKRRYKKIGSGALADLLNTQYRIKFNEKKQLELFMRFYTFRKALKTNEAIAACKNAYVEHIGEEIVEVKILSELQKEGRYGGSFSTSETLKKWFTPSIRMMFSVVEKQSSGVEVDARKLQHQKEQEVKITKEAKKSMFTGVKFIIGGLLAFLVSAKIVPDFANSMDLDLQMITVDVAVMLKDHLFGTTNWLTYGLSFLVFWVFLKMVILPNWTGRVRRQFDDNPVFSTYKALEAARFFTVLALLKESGYRTRYALESMKEILPRYTRSYLDEMLRKIQQGGDMSAILGSDLLNPYQRVRLTSIMSAGTKGDDTVGKALSALSDNMVADTMDTLNIVNKSTQFILIGIGVILSAVGMYNIGKIMILMMEQA